MKVKPFSKLLAGGALLLGLAGSALAYEQGWEPRDLSTSETTKVVMLGTGNPMPYPHRNGPSIAVVVNEKPYIFDAGEGLWRGMGREMPYFGESRVKGFSLKNNKATRLFISHLHTDHTIGVPALILMPWNLGRQEQVHVYGPRGTKELVDGILTAYRRDIDYRVYSPTQKNNEGWRAKGFEISKEGLAYEDENVKVYAYKACHGLWTFPISYRVETPDRTIAITGDTVADCDGVRKAGKDVDILLTEAYTYKAPDPKLKIWPQKKKISVADQKKLMHSSTKELVRVMEELKPGLLVTYHEQNFTDNPTQLADEIKDFGYKGKYISSRDGDIY
jgi:ribonuclease Z